MSTTINFKDIIDKPEWRPLAVCPASHAAGVCLTSDLRNNETRHPELFMLGSATTLYAYNTKNDGWMLVGSPALTNTFGAGASCIFIPNLGPTGTIGSGSSSTSIVTSTTWTIPANALANRCDGKGFKVRIIGKVAGKTEEKWVTSNTVGSTSAITFTLDSALSFTPSSGDSYEFLSGRVYMINTGTAAAGQFKYYDIATSTFSGNLSITNLGTLATDTQLVSLSESYVPYTKTPGDGFFGLLTATASASGTITGHATGGDSAVLANEYRNFQIRIVADSTTPASVGQRRVITSHTAGVSPVYTLSSAWTTTPSATAQYVIENPNYLLLTTGGTTTIYTYNPTPNAIVMNSGTSLAADSWNTTCFGARGTAMAAGGCFEQCFGITPDVNKGIRHSHILSFRGGTSIILDLLDIAASATGTWTNGVSTCIPTGASAIGTGTSWAYAPADKFGQYLYYSRSATNEIYRFDIYTKKLETWAQMRWPQSGTAAVGNRMAAIAFVDDNIAISNIHFLSHLSPNFFDILSLR